MNDKIITDEKILRQVSRPTTWEEVKKLDLIARLKKACPTAWTPGCGLAAIQIGVPVRFAWYVWQKKDYFLLNPEIRYRYGRASLKEGCLSVPHNWAIVTRSNIIEYWTVMEDTGLPVQKKAKGYQARIIQHEMDHMDGILNIDYPLNKKVTDADSK